MKNDAQEKLYVYLDDERTAPPTYDVHCSTAEEVIELIRQGKVEFVSLDNDLGIGYSEGKRVAQFIEREYICGNIPFVDFHPHTSNPVAFEEIMQCKRNVYKHKKSQEEAVSK